MIIIEDYQNVKEFLENIGINRIGHAVDNPIQSLFKYQTPSHEIMISVHPTTNYLIINYVYSDIIGESPIELSTGMGTFKTETIFSDLISSWEHLRTVLHRYNGELFREQTIDQILN